MRAKTIFLLLITLLLTSAVNARSRYPKREFRGAWIQCVNGQFQGMPAEKMQQLLIRQLNSLQEAGINAIIFQVRAEADALYKSSYEPWSRFLTGVQGRVPSPYWDPMQFMIDECHKRGMEFHAWINPYRAKTKGTVALSPIHPYNRNPERFVTYAGQLYFDPALPENRKYICKIVRDIVTRYDVDAIHMDDYFYPYPNPGEDFPDNISFAQYGRGYSNKADWRRDNVNVLIKEIHETVRECKPWVKFGISPFGIYRNVKSDPNGSNTRGLQNYDDLYADVLMWVNNGWVDYNIPQVYWEIGHPAADYDTLIRWWAKNASARPLYIGQDVMRTVNKPDLHNPLINQMPAKMKLQRALPTVQGSCQWYASAVADAGRRIGGESLAAGSIEPAHCVEQADQPFLYGILKVKPRGGAGRRAAADGRHHAGNQRSKRIFVPLLCAHRQVLLDRGLGQRHGLFLREDANNLIIAGNCAFVNVFFVGSAGKRKGFPP